MVIATGHAGALAQGSGTLAQGTITRLDMERREITLDHGPLLNLGLPPRIGTFAVTDAALLKGLKAGDTILFLAERRDSTLAVVRIETGHGDGHGDH
jgi:Cu/Ag efflux protein CusF